MSKEEDQATGNAAAELENRQAAYEAKKATLPDAAKRALAEAEARRTAEQAQTQAQGERPAEYHGQKGPEPTRYGDWEKKGIISDF